MSNIFSYQIFQYVKVRCLEKRTRSHSRVNRERDML